MTVSLSAPPSASPLLLDNKPSSSSLLKSSTFDGSNGTDFTNSENLNPPTHFSPQPLSKECSENNLSLSVLIPEISTLFNGVTASPFVFLIILINVALPIALLNLLHTFTSLSSAELLVISLSPPVIFNAVKFIWKRAFEVIGFLVILINIATFVVTLITDNATILQLKGAIAQLFITFLLVGSSFLFFHTERKVIEGGEFHLPFSIRPMFYYILRDIFCGVDDQKRILLNSMFTIIPVNVFRNRVMWWGVIWSIPSFILFVFEVPLIFFIPVTLFSNIDISSALCLYLAVLAFQVWDWRRFKVEMTVKMKNELQDQLGTIDVTIQ